MSTAPKPENTAPTWDERHLAESLDAEGWALLPGLLPPSDCAALAALYDAPQHFRSRIVMARHGFGRGEYQYFAYPLPPLIEGLRHALYPPLARIANAWQARLSLPVRYPAELPEFLARCHTAGQTRPTPLLLRYGAGDHNCLHQDLYGEHVFPLQLAILPPADPVARLYSLASSRRDGSVDLCVARVEGGRIRVRSRVR